MVDRFRTVPNGLLEIPKKRSPLLDRPVLPLPFQLPEELFLLPYSAMIRVLEIAP
jgi:hypothetical protein